MSDIDTLKERAAKLRAKIAECQLEDQHVGEPNWVDDDGSERYEPCHGCLSDAVTAGLLEDAASAIATETARADLFEAESNATRTTLWLGHRHVGIYGDDGEMQCGECVLNPPGERGTDYKRDPLNLSAISAIRALQRQADEATARADREAEQHRAREVEWVEQMFNISAELEIMRAERDREATARQEAERKRDDLQKLWDYWTARAVTAEAERDALRADMKLEAPAPLLTEAFCEDYDGRVIVVKAHDGRFVRWATDAETERHKRLCAEADGGNR